jgi:ABC-2 type transport system ATP-binding protein
MDDVTALCPRVIVINEGKLLYDGDLAELAKRVHPDKLVTFILSEDADETRFATLGNIVEVQGTHITLQVSSSEVRNVVSYALANLNVADLRVEDPPLEDIMRQLFASQGKQNA